MVDGLWIIIVFCNARNYNNIPELETGNKEIQRYFVPVLQFSFSERSVFSGYDYGYPFIDKDVVDVQENVLDFYLYEFLPDMEKQTIAFIGCIQPTGAIMPIAEMQCRYAMQVFKVNEHIYRHICVIRICMATVKYFYPRFVDNVFHKYNPVTSIYQYIHYNITSAF